MSISVTPLHPLFGARVEGLDAARPTPALRARIERLMDEYAVIVLADQDMEAEDQVAFTRLFGDLEPPPAARGDRGERRSRLPPEVFPITNMNDDGTFQKEDDAARRYRIANSLWHTDSSFRQTGATYSMLHAKIVPPFGADTEFVDTRAVWDALPDALKAKCEGLVANHSIWHSRGQLGGYEPTPEEIVARPPAQHPLVRVNPRTGRRGLYIASHVSHIVGMDPDESRALLDELMAFATQARFVHAHKWAVHDMAIWDNRFSMHRATAFEDFIYVRDLRRTTVREYPKAV
jgi:alpha-ketoglutarate-dependent 2,4-dichlorophenoxyacetate dioxygenase